MSMPVGHHLLAGLTVQGLSVAHAVHVLVVATLVA